MTELAPAFMMLASNRDVDSLFSLLPYKTLTFSKIEGRHGIYALIDKNENRDRDIRKPRPSIRAQLAADKKKAAPKLERKQSVLQTYHKALQPKTTVTGKEAGQETSKKAKKKSNEMEL